MTPSILAPWRSSAGFAIAGAAAFWLPRLVSRALEGCDSDWFVLSFLLPAATTAAFVLLVWRTSARPGVIGACMLAGIWLLGSGAMVAGATMCGGGLQQGVGGSIVVLLLGILPPYTFVMATYDGTLFALLLVSALLLVASLVLEYFGERWRRRTRP